VRFSSCDALILYGLPELTVSYLWPVFLWDCSFFFFCFFGVFFFFFFALLQFFLYFGLRPVVDFILKS